MSRISVLVPTAARPGTLEITLRSIARQTARDQIKEVIVSENLSDPRSGDVCAMFPELPIRYVLREPELGMFHFETLFGEATGEITAFVCDDDLWSPGHLQTALDSLDRHPDSAAHFSAIVQAESELARNASMYGVALLWLVAGCPPRMSEYVYDLTQILALCWVVTPFSWSTLVARRDAAADAAKALMEAGHPFYADRMIYPALARHGNLVFDPAPDTIYRLHLGNWQTRQDPQLLGALLRDCWSEVESLARDAAVDLPTLWQGYLAATPDWLADEMRGHMWERFSNDELVRHGFDAFVPLVPPPPPAWRRYGGRMKRALLALKG